MHFRSLLLLVIDKIIKIKINSDVLNNHKSIKYNQPTKEFTGWHTSTIYRKLANNRKSVSEVRHFRNRSFLINQQIIDNLFRILHLFRNFLKYINITYLPFQLRYIFFRAHSLKYLICVLGNLFKFKWCALLHHNKDIF